MIDPLKYRAYRQCWRIAALAALLLTLEFNANAQGIVYGTFPATSPLIPESPFYSYDSVGYQLVSFEPTQAIYYNLALGKSGATHFIFNSGTDFSITGYSNTDQVLSYQQGPLFSPWAIPISTGTSISDDAGQFEWTSGLSVISASRASDEIGNPILTIGYFTQMPSGYMGLRFQENGQTFYGWVRVGAPFAGINGGWLYDYAYSTSPNTPIVAGQATCTPMSISRIGNSQYLRLNWYSTVSATYQVQYKEQINATTWSNTDFTITANTTNATVNLPMTGNSRFYRVIQVNLSE